jgi:hypothetical protein
MKKFLLLFLVFTSISSSQVVSQNTGETDSPDINLANSGSSLFPYSKAITAGWYPANTFPLLPDSTIYPAAAIIGDTIYVQKPEWTGSSTYASSNVIKYRINRYGGGGWSNAASLPLAKVGGSMTACNGKLYFIGGDNSNITLTGTNTVYEYSPATGVWTTKAPMPAALAAHSSVCWGDSVIFVIGGPYNSSATNLNVYFYRPASNTWGTITNSLPSGQGRRTFSAGIYQNKIIIGGGYGSVWLKNVFVGTIGSNASQITWVAAPDLPIAASYTGLARAGGTAVNDFFFVVAGQYSSGFRSDSTLIYQFSTNSWVSVIDNKPFNGDNIFNGVVSRIELNDTIQVYSPGIYRGATIGGTRVFDVFKFKFTPDGISVFDKQPQLKLFPNPSSGIININTGQQSFSAYTMEIINNQGQIVYSSNVTKEDMQIELGDLPKGIYIIKIQNAYILKTQKLILN